MEKYDVVVIGAGPAGSLAARKVAEAGFSVLLLEKRQEVGAPVRCAEGVSAKWLEKHSGIKDRWISTEIKGAILASPSGKKAYMEYNETGYIIDRKVFDYDLAVMAANAGAVVRTKSGVVGIEKENGTFFIRVEGLSNYEVVSKIVIAADGIESKIGKMLGVDTTLKPNDVEFCMQYTLDNIDIEKEYIEMIGGNNYAPGGYVWIFPKGDHSANVGLGVVGSRSSYEYNARYYLDKFIAERFPNASISRVIPGAVSVSAPLDKMAGDGFMIVGDAAHLANPLTGAGIGNALESGAIAGEVAAVALKKGDWSEKTLLLYKKRVMDSIGNTTKRFHHIKDAFIKFSDKDIENMISLAAKVDPKKSNLRTLLELGFRENKKIIGLLKKLF